MVMKPEVEEELRRRITEHLNARPSNDRVVLVWRGYLAGLLEWAGLGIHAYERLMSLLPDSGDTEVAEMLVEPEWKEMVKLSDEEYYKLQNDEYEQQKNK